jgi:ribosomal protein S18 acetylase RimI-like enzyme
VRVRQGGGRDLDAIAAVHREAVLTGYASIVPADAPKPSPAQLRRDWENSLDDGAVALVAEEASEIIGTVLTRADPDFPGGQLRWLTVVPSLWGRGVGGKLHDAALLHLAQAGFVEAGLWVLEENDRARGMYERRGWQLVHQAVHTWPGLDVGEVRYRRSIR